MSLPLKLRHKRRRQALPGLGRDRCAFVLFFNKICLLPECKICPLGRKRERYPAPRGCLLHVVFPAPVSHASLRVLTQTCLSHSPCKPVSRLKKLTQSIMQITARLFHCTFSHRWPISRVRQREIKGSKSQSKAPCCQIRSGQLSGLGPRGLHSSILVSPPPIPFFSNFLRC